MSKYERNLTQGNLAGALIRFSLPFLASNIVQSLYNVADMLIVGNFSGTVSMSGVNIGGQVTFILTNIMVGLCTGGTVLIAQYVGSGDRDRMQRTVSTLITALSYAALFITALMLVFKNPILRLIQTPAESFAEASAYLLVTSLGILFIFGYNALSGILRGMGDSKRPFYFVLIACITNIVLDLLFVAVFHMGAFGAAVATVISQALSMLLCIFSLRRSGFVFDFHPKSFRIDRAQLGMIVKIGAPTAVQNGIVSLSFLFITTLVNMIGGVTASAAVGVVGKFNSFALMPAIAMSAAISTTAAQNIGADKWDRAIRACRIGTAIGVSISLCIFALAQLFPEAILMLFDRDPQMIAHGVSYLRVFSLDYLIVPWVFCINGLLTGAGHTTFTLITGSVSSLIVRIPACYLFGVTLSMGIRGVGLGAPAASAAALLIILGYLLSGKWRVNKVAQRMQKLDGGAQA
ncbi:MAG: MATE family efflux transporter [Clostridia bacterium]|nr:MATE family efflux transporter [Clostridia bacterium]